VRPKAAIRAPVGRGVIAVALLALAGCVTTPVPRTPAEAPEPVAEPVAQAAPSPEAEPAVTPVLVVLDDSRGRDSEMLQVFSARLGRPYEILNLAHRTPAAVAERLDRAAPADVIALGPAATAATRGVPGLRVVHASVFEAVPGSDGVDALPPFPVQLDYWLQVHPDLRRLGVIGSSRMMLRLEELGAACLARGLTLERRIVESDQEMLRSFRALVPRIDGFVFLPDETVLSPEVIREVIAHGRRNNVQILVYSPVMFNLGATLYVQPDPVAVAMSLIALLEQGGTPPAVTEMRVRDRQNGTLALSSAAAPRSPEDVGY